MGTRFLKLLSLASLATLILTAATAAYAVDGTGKVTVTSATSCVVGTPPNGNGPFNWEVAEGGSYTMTITGVTECTGDSITVFVQSTEHGNWCFNATGGSGTYSGNFTMPNPACNTMPISYKCGANASCDNIGAFDAQGPNGESSVHLRAAIFGDNCALIGTDTNCDTTTCKITCPPDKTVDQDCSLEGAGAHVSFDPATTDCGNPIVCDHESGSLFPIGTTIVTCSTTDANGKTVSCSFKVTVNEGSCPPKLHCDGLNIDQCNDVDDDCGATILIAPPTAFGSPAPTVTGTITFPDGTTKDIDSATSVHFPVGTSTIHWVASNTAGTDSCDVTVNIRDCNLKIKCPSDVSQCLKDVNGNFINLGSPTAYSACKGVQVVPPFIGFERSDHKDILDPFGCGITLVTWTVSNEDGRSASCTQTVEVHGVTINVHKFYDFDQDGKQGNTELPLANVTFTVTSGPAGVDLTGLTGTTDNNGNLSFGGAAKCLPEGTYVITETLPAGYVATTPNPATVTIADECSATVNFGDVCIKTPGGLTIGFWSNKNGQALENAADMCALTGMNLRNANGSNFDPISTAYCPNPTSSQLSAAKTAYSKWLLAASATNMANMLSAQLSATYLNVAHGITTNPGVIVGKDICGNNMDVNQLITYANALLSSSISLPNGCTTFAGLNGSSTVGASALRTEQERIKNILDKINNGGGFAQETPCPF